MPATPVGIIRWNDQTPKPSSKSAISGIKSAVHARIRGRQFATLEHLCSAQNLLYADIHKQDAETLHSTLTQWECDLVITSRCSFVPSTGLPQLTHGAINMHPSWLPDYRGGDPILWQIAEDQKDIATSIHRLTDEYDKGAVLAQKRTARPNGLSKAALLGIADRVLGRELLSDIIASLMSDSNPDDSAADNMDGIEQPEKSPTRYAPARSPSAFASEHPINEGAEQSFSAQTLWDLTHYFGHCPDQWLALSGWRKRFDWCAVRMDQQNTATDKTLWQVNSAGLSMYLVSDQATIELKPKLTSLIRRLRQ